MAAATSWGGLVRDADRATANPLSLRLPPSDVAALRFVMGGMESLVGLGSNFGAMCQRLEEGTVPSGTLGTSWEVESARLDASESGAVGSSGFVGQRIHVHTGHAPYRVDQLTKIEAWACWSNHASGGRNEPLGRRADIAYHTLVEMVDRGQKRHVVTLYLMYSDATPASRRSDFGRSDAYGLADFVPLALETETVLRHAKKMTAELRRELAEKFAGDRMVTVDADSRRPCRCRVHTDTDDSCPSRGTTDARSPGDRDDGCKCSGPAPHVMMLCPARKVAPAFDAVGDGHWLRIRGAVGRREAVSPLEALRDLLAPVSPPRGALSLADHRAEVHRRNEARAVHAADIRVEAHQMLVAASKSYKSAKAKVTR